MKSLDLVILAGGKGTRMDGNLSEDNVVSINNSYKNLPNICNKIFHIDENGNVKN